MLEKIKVNELQKMLKGHEDERVLSIGSGCVNGIWKYYVELESGEMLTTPMYEKDLVK